MKNVLKQIFPVSLALAVAGGFSSCTPGQQLGAQYGALGGAGVGALSGDGIEGIVKKAGVGAAIGAATVAVKEGSFPGQNGNSTTGSTTQTQNYPYATATGTSGYVKSPYSPYNTVDVRGIASGTRVMEPGSSNVFIVP